MIERSYLHQKLMALKCFVNLTRFGDFSSFCSFTQSKSSVGSSFQKCCASNKVICSAKSDDLKCRSDGGCLPEKRHIRMLHPFGEHDE